MRMASWLTRLRYKNVSRKLVLKILVAVATIGGLYLLLSPSNKNKYGVVNYVHDGDGGDVMPQPEIDAYMRVMLDTRPQFCHGRSYGEMAPDRVSIILDYNEEQFYDLKLTLHSIIEHTPEFLIQDIVLLDDGSVKDAVRKHALSYLRDPKFEKVKAFRSDDAHGPSLSRFKASKVASGSILVFVSSSVVVNVGWLQPLMEAVRYNRKVIAVPHHDNLLQGQRFYKSDDNMVNMFGWTLTTVHLESLEEVGDQYLTTPAMRGDAFAVDKDYFSSIGNYDDGMDGGGGHNLELSIRAWLCGGGMHVVPCSRVAVHSAFKPLQVNSARNFRRIAEMWLGDGYKKYAYSQGEVSNKLTTTEKNSLNIRQAYLRKTVTCKDFSWYVNNIVPDLIIPSKEMAHLGKIKGETGHCVRSVSDDTDELDLVLCRPHVYNTDMIFELTKAGFLRIGERCLGSSSQDKVQLAECIDGNLEQMWNYNRHKQLASTEVRTKCLTQGTGTSYHLKVDKCDSENAYQRWSFVKY